MASLKHYIINMKVNIEEHVKKIDERAQIARQWENVTTAVQANKWDTVEKHLEAFEKTFNTIHQVNLLSSPKFCKYAKYREEMLLNIRGCTPGKALTKLQVTQRSPTQAQARLEQDRKRSYEDDAIFMYAWIKWLDEEAISTQVKETPIDPKNIKKENVSDKVLQLEEIIKRAANMVIRLRNEKGDLLEDNIKLRKINSKLEKNALKHIGEKMQDELNKLKAEKRNLLETLQKSEEEKEYWINRVSKIAGNKLSDNNPGITDLSDKNRPQKIAEKYAELYDNEWTDALDKFKGKNVQDEHSIQKLADMLKVCHQSCRQIASRHLKHVYNVLITVKPITTKEKIVNSSHLDAQNDTVDEEKIPKNLFDARKDTTSLLLSSVKEVIVQDLEKTYKGEFKKVANYVDKCIEITWRMVIQRPELCFVWPTVGKDEKLNMDQFSHYTQNGLGVQYVVWPAMVLYENGPILRKGTVQPYFIEQ